MVHFCLEQKRRYISEKNAAMKPLQCTLFYDYSQWSWRKLMDAFSAVVIGDQPKQMTHFTNAFTSCHISWLGWSDDLKIYSNNNDLFSIIIKNSLIIHFLFHWQWCDQNDPITFVLPNNGTKRGSRIIIS